MGCYDCANHEVYHHSLPILQPERAWQVRYDGTEQENPLEDTLEAKCLQRRGVRKGYALPPGKGKQVVGWYRQPPMWIVNSGQEGCYVKEMVVFYVLSKFPCQGAPPPSLISHLLTSCEFSPRWPQLVV